MFVIGSWAVAILAFLYFKNQDIFFPAIGGFIEINALFVFVLPIIASLVSGLNFMFVRFLSLSMTNQRVIQYATLVFEILLFFNTVLIFLFNY